MSSHGEVASLFSLGKSFEGRELLGVRLSSGRKERARSARAKPALFVDAGIHAREWIAPTTALYAIQQLAGNDSQRGLLDRVDVYVVPSLNPDGYEYSHRSIGVSMSI